MKEGGGPRLAVRTILLAKQWPHPNAAKFSSTGSFREGQVTLQRALAKRPTRRRLAENDIPKDDVPAENKRMDGMKYLDLDVEGKLEMKPIVD